MTFLGMGVDSFQEHKNGKVFDCDLHVTLPMNARYFTKFGKVCQLDHRNELYHVQIKLVSLVDFSYPNEHDSAKNDVLSFL